MSDSTCVSDKSVEDWGRFTCMQNSVYSRLFTSLPLKKARSSTGAPVVLRATGPLV